MPTWKRLHFVNNAKLAYEIFPLKMGVKGEFYLAGLKVEQKVVQNIFESVVPIFHLVLSDAVGAFGIAGDYLTQNAQQNTLRNERRFFFTQI